MNISYASLLSASWSRVRFSALKPTFLTDGFRDAAQFFKAEGILK
jgi:hypothetical protein